jgi:hypothetical protein
MKLLGFEVNDFDKDGFSIRDTICNWLDDPAAYDLEMISTDRDQIKVLNKFQEIALLSGATTIRQVEYIYKLEERLKVIESNLNLSWLV